MKSIILPIKSKYVEKILSSEKKYEYRKKLCSKDIERIYIYETSPVKKIVGEAYIDKKIFLDKEVLWNMSKDFSGINKLDYDKYFSTQEKAGAYSIKSVKKYKTPITLDSIGINYTPQSFVYFDEEIYCD